MSKANSAVKVLRTALKRVQQRWGKGAWSRKGSDGQYKVCLEGAIFGFCHDVRTAPQKEAWQFVHKALKQLHPKHGDIPSFNDSPATTQDDVLEVIKLAIIKAESGDITDAYIDPEEVDSIIEKVD